MAQFKSTVLLMPNGSDRITAAPLQPLSSEKKIESEELRKLLASSVKSKARALPLLGLWTMSHSNMTLATGGVAFVVLQAAGGYLHAALSLGPGCCHIVHGLRGIHLCIRHTGSFEECSRMDVVTPHTPLG